ncbi:DUF4198 domain-containing protein [Imhoffiella purpurea]|uniref:ABC-type Co2+ transport system, periplasmic component n=1 Tax=Imhoffiella purpurea TaxID=1249627 RepID=W9V7W9_9GAMM|nr:DUF4198 domain-containing protein [Imhoffiella purpurea]EXJ15678.1 hypothetical protein D779_1185 [Imhoffiella purpurea]
MSNPKMTAAALAASLALLPIASQAHDYWIMPGTFDPAPGTLLEAHFTSGHGYFVDESVPDVTGFRAFERLPDGREIALAYQQLNATRATLSAVMLGEGTYMLGAVSTRPQFWSRTKSGHAPGQKMEVPDAVVTTRYLKSIKTFVTVGQPSGGWDAALGHEIELIPLANPTTLSAGDRLAVRVLLHGRPIADAEVHAVHQGFESEEREAAVSTATNAEGEAEIALDRPGPWLVYARVEREAPPASGVDRENLRAYLLTRVARPGAGARP